MGSSWHPYCVAIHGLRRCPSSVSRRACCLSPSSAVSRSDCTIASANSIVGRCLQLSSGKPPTAQALNDMTPADNMTEYVTAIIGGQLFGVPITRVQDVFVPDRLTKVP